MKIQRATVEETVMDLIERWCGAPIVVDAQRDRYGVTAIPEEGARHTAACGSWRSVVHPSTAAALGDLMAQLLAAHAPGGHGERWTVLREAYEDIARHGWYVWPETAPLLTPEMRAAFERTWAAHRVAYDALRDHPLGGARV